MNVIPRDTRISGTKCPDIDRFMRKDRAAYDRMYELIRPVVKAVDGVWNSRPALIPQNIVNAAAHQGDRRLCGEDDRRGKRDTRSAKKLLLRAGWHVPTPLPCRPGFNVVIVSSLHCISCRSRKALARSPGAEGRR